MAKIGRVLWWDKRDLEGVIVDGIGNQYYFNHSVLRSSSLERLRDGLFVEFEVSNAVPYVSCASKVAPITSKEHRKAERSFIGQKQLTLGGL